MGQNLSFTSKEYQALGDLPHYQTSLVFTLGQVRGDWQEYQIRLITPEHEFDWQGENLLFSHDGQYSELESFACELEVFFADSKETELTFIPQEPNFELRLERSKQSSQVKLYFWFDHGNYLNNSYSSWDGLGVRFFIDTFQLV